MILTARQAEKALIKRSPDEKRRVIAAFAEYRDIAGWKAKVYQQDADREEVTPEVLWCRFWCRFWRLFEARHKAHIRWVEALQASEQGGS